MIEIGVFIKVGLNKLLLNSYSWSSGNALVSESEGLRFKCQTGQIGHIVANRSPPLWHLFESSFAGWAQWLVDGPRQLAARYGVLQLVQ